MDLPFCFFNRFNRTINFIMFYFYNMKVNWLDTGLKDGLMSETDNQ